MPQLQVTSPVARLRDALVQGAMAGGGLAYYAGKASRLEPTCWALLALGPTLPEHARHRAFLEQCQRRGGWLVEDEQWPVNVAPNALTAFTWLSQGDAAAPDRLRRLLAALTEIKGIRAEPLDGSPQDNTLQGWPWTDGTFSWVEPTAWGLLALKRAQQLGIAPGNADARIEEAERVLLDRICRDGGWNFGNATVLYQDLRPYVGTTALALLALQNRRDEPAVAQSLALLEARWPEEISAAALGLAAISLAAFDRPTRALDARLGEHAPQAVEFGNLHGIAVALAALTPSSRDAFRL
jgi:hypothetical protein